MNQESQAYRQRLRQTTAEAGRLPVPDADAIAHSQQLIELIRHEMGQSGGAISFARYMELALMAPGLGYYSAGSRKFGEQGDFVTAPEISPLFSRCVARQCVQVLNGLREADDRNAPQAVDILEFGAGTGVMAADVLLELEQQQSLPDHYYILELSADLRQRQHDTLTARASHLLQRVYWLDALPDQPLRGVILANEVLDAMPVHRIHIKAGVAQEYFVGWKDEQFVWQLHQIGHPALQQRLEALTQTVNEYTTEVNLAMEAWLRSLATVLAQGLVLLIDYGFPRAEYYHPQRSEGTLMCHYRHRAHADPFVYPGLQDITAHVDFTAVAEAAVESGFDLAGFTPQGHFLLSCGLTDMLADLAEPESTTYLALVQQVRTLTSPEQMGELFKVMALGKSLEPLDIGLLGFGFRDQRSRL